MARAIPSRDRTRADPGRSGCSARRLWHTRPMSRRPPRRILGLHPETWAGLSPNGIGQQKPHHLREMLDASPTGPELTLGHEAWTTIRGFRKPLVAAVNGLALGGGFELALQADVIIAGEGASFGLPELGHVILPGAGGTQRLLRALGYYRAMHLILTRARVDAATAADLGLVAEVVADDEALPRALVLAADIATLPASAVQALKMVLRKGADLPLDAALQIERQACLLLLADGTAQHRMAAFLSTRKEKNESGS